MNSHKFIRCITVLFFTNFYTFGQFIDQDAIWNKRGPSGISSTFNDLIYDHRDSSHKEVWLCTWTGIWHSVDFNQDSPEWTLVAKGVGTQSIIQHPVNHNLFYASGNTGIYKSTDGGQTWSLVTYEIIYNGSFLASSNGDLFYFKRIGWDRKLYKIDLSNDQFVPVFDPQFDAPSETGVFLTDADLDHNGNIYLSFANGKIYKSATPFGGSWANIFPNFIANTNADTRLAIGKGTNNEVVLTTFNINNDASWNHYVSYTKTSNDGGITWSDIIPTDTNGKKFSSIGTYNEIVFGSSPQQIALSGGSSLYISNDGGSSWISSIHIFAASKLIFSPNSDLIFLDPYNLSRIPSPFTIGSLSSESKQGDIHSVMVNNFSYYNSYHDNRFIVNQFDVIGADILSTKNENQYSGIHFTDRDEPDFNIYIKPNPYVPDTLFIRNRAFEVLHTQVLDSLDANMSYEYVENSIYQIIVKPAEGYSIIRKIGNLDKPTSRIQDFKVARILPNFSKITPTSNSEVFLYGFSLGKEILKITLNEDLTTTVTTLDPLPNVVTDLKVFGLNNEILIANNGNHLSASLNGGLSWNNSISTNRANHFEVNPSNPQQCFLASTNHLYFTENLLESSPSWTAFTHPNLNGYFNIIKVWFRESDGTLFAYPPNAGIFSAEIINTNNEISIINQPKIVRPGEVFKFTFVPKGPFSEDNTYELILSDENGEFVNSIKIGETTSSPFLSCLPSSTLPGSSYQLKVISKNTNTDLIEAISEPIEVSMNKTDLYSTYSSGYQIIENKNIINSFEILTNTSRSNYYAWNEILLNPGFLSMPSSGGNFMAEITGCNY